MGGGEIFDCMEIGKMFQWLTCLLSPIHQLPTSEGRGNSVRIICDLNRQPDSW